jgi:hypothetical protein
MITAVPGTRDDARLFVIKREMRRETISAIKKDRSEIKNPPVNANRVEKMIKYVIEPVSFRNPR